MMRYCPEVFVRKTISEAQAIILMPEAGLSTAERWGRETDWLMERIAFDAIGLVVDYGCGIGRLSKRLERRPVLGVDISSTMRASAEQYVRRNDFGAVCPPMLGRLVAAGVRAQGAIAAWVLQHCLDPRSDIELLASVLVPDAPLWVVNMDDRAVPMTDGASIQWLSDGEDINALLGEHFTLAHEEPMPAHLCAPGATFSKWLRL